MFTQDFYPTPLEVIEQMTDGEILENKVILEPSAGKGNIVDYLLLHGAKNVLACESNQDLQLILQSKCNLIESDFLNLTSDKISHIDAIYMNPPFSADDKHIIHAFNIAPEGCKIVALCNSATLENAYSKTRKELTAIIETYGRKIVLGDCFSGSERKTGVNVTLIKIQKAGANYNTEFEGFFMDDEPDEIGQNGIISYNVVRDLVNRYVGAVKIFDEQLEAAVRMNNLTSGYYSCAMGMHVTEKQKPIQREEFKKAMQKSGWMWIFAKMDMQKHTTQGLRDDINKFVEKQTDVPFTMRNIYKMLEIVIQTTGQRMDKALLEVFDWVTKHDDENKYGLPGWKTNSYYLLNRKFIVPNLCWQDPKWHKGESNIRMTFGGYAEKIEDFVKALCYISGDNYDNFVSLYDYCQYDWKLTYDKTTEVFRDDMHYSGANDRKKALATIGVKAEIDWLPIRYGQPFEWGYFKCRAYKKGTMHFEFKTEDLWARFNQRIAKLKGYPLYAHKERKEAKKTTNKTTSTATGQTKVLFEI